MRAWLIGAALALSATAPAQAQEAGSRETRDFVAAAAGSDAYEMFTADAALAQSRDPQVRAFAERMLADHGRTSAALAQAATQSGLTPPPMQMGADQAALFTGLGGLRGAEFDKAFWKGQALAHYSALVTEEGYAANGDAPALRQAAKAAVPIIRGHLDMAERMVARSGG